MPRILTGTDSSPPQGRFGIIVSRYNESITRRLLDGALETLAAAGIRDDVVDVCWVPGAWELPLVARELSLDSRYVAIVCLGAVIRGETTHDEHINRQVSLSLGQIGLESGLPVAFGVLTCNSLEQALQRAGGTVGNKGQEAAAAALEMARLMARVRLVTGSPSADGPSSVAASFAARDSDHDPRPPVPPTSQSPDAAGPPGPARGVQSLFPDVRLAGASAGSESSLEAPADDSVGGAAGAAAGGPAPGRRGPRIRRRRAREVVLQMLYADDVNPSRSMSEADAFLRRRLSFDPALVEFAASLLAGVRRNRAELDQILTRQAANWSLPRMAVTDRNVLRLGAFEILFTATPRGVVINEAVELARRYGSRQSAQFVNGILDRLHAEPRNSNAE